MNTANLQLEGVLIAMCAMMKLMRERELASREDIDEALQAAETAELDHRRPGQLSPANVEAVLFPLRFLRIANSRVDTAAVFSEIAAEVGRAGWRKIDRSGGDGAQ